MFPSDLTWTCHICKRERPDAAIDVAYRPLRGMEDRFPDVRFNLRFCNDTTDCIARAHGTGPWPEPQEEA